MTMMDGEKKVFAFDFLLSTTGGGIALFDYDNDGWLDIFVVNSWGFSGFPKDKEPINHLYKNNRVGTFTDVTAKANLVRSGWGQGVCVGDYNNDGFMDLFVTYYGKNVLYRNNGDGTFTPATLLTMFARCSAAERTRLRTCSGRIAEGKAKDKTERLCR